MSLKSDLTCKEVEEWEELELIRERDLRVQYCKYVTAINHRHQTFLKRKEVSNLRQTSLDGKSPTPPETTHPEWQLDSQNLSVGGVLDDVLRLIAQPYVLPSSASGSQLRLEIIRSGIFSAHHLDASRHYIETTFLRLRQEQVALATGIAATKILPREVSRGRPDVSARQESSRLVFHNLRRMIQPDEGIFLRARTDTSLAHGAGLP